MSRLMATALSLAIVMLGGFAMWAGAATYLIHADGSGDFATIQAGIDAASTGDTIELADGTFVGSGNRNLDFHGKDLVVRSQSGDPTAVVIDCDAQGRGFHFHSGESRAAKVQGITIVDGSSDHGGGIRCEGSSPTIEGNIIRDNFASGAYGGGGIFCGFAGADPLIQGNLIIENRSAWGSAGIYVYDAGSTPVITQNTVVGNRTFNTDVGGGIYIRDFADVTVTNNIVAFNTGRGLAGSPGTGADLACNDVFGNTVSNYYGIPDLTGVDGNISADPLFCEAEADDYSLDASSPCLPLSPDNPSCGLIGALPEGCGTPPAADPCYPLDTEDPGVFTFLDGVNYLHGAFPVLGQTVADGDRMSFDMRITDCSVPGSFGAGSAIGFTTEADPNAILGIVLLYDDQTCYQVRLFSDLVQGTVATLSPGVTYSYEFEYASGLVTLWIRDESGGVVHTDTLAHTPIYGDIFQIGVDYPGGGTEYFRWGNERVEFRVDRAADPSHAEGWIDNVSTPGCNYVPPSSACYTDCTEIITFLDGVNYLHAGFPVQGHTIVDGDRMSFEMRITDCSVPGNFGAGSAIGFTTEGDPNTILGIVLLYDDQTCYQVRLFSNFVQGTVATLSPGVTYRYEFEYAGGMVTLWVRDESGSVVHMDTLAHTPIYGDFFQIGVDYPGGGTEYFRCGSGRWEFRVDRAADPSHAEGWFDDVSTPGCDDVPLPNPCYTDCTDIITFLDGVNYLHGGFPVQGHTIVDGDRMSFDLRISDCSAPGNFGAGSAIGFTTEADPNTILGIVLLYDDQTCYQVRLFSNFVQGTVATLSPGVTYRYEFEYASGMVTLWVRDESGSVVHMDTLAHTPIYGDFFQIGVDYPGGGTEYFRCGSGRWEFRVDRAADPSHAEGWFDNVTTPGCQEQPPFEWCYTACGEIIEFLDGVNYLHAGFPILGHTIADGERMSFDMRITDCSVPGDFGAGSAIGFTTMGNPNSIFGIVLYYDDQTCYRVRLLNSALEQGVWVTLSPGVTYSYELEYSNGTLTLWIRDEFGVVVHTDALPQEPIYGDLFQIGVDYPGGGTEDFWCADGWAFRLDRAADPSHIEGVISDVCFHQSISDLEGPEAVARLTLRAAPNPSRLGTVFSFEVPQAQRVRLAVFDAGGRRVSTLVDAELPAGAHNLAWDGRSMTGDRVPAGVYFARLTTAAAGAKSATLVVLR